MLFNSLHYLLFLPSVVILYFLISQNNRWKLLLLASCYFYMVLIPKYIIILFTIILVDFYAAIKMEESSKKARKWLLGLSLIFNVGFLCVFKYYNFFIENVAEVFAFNNQPSVLIWALPIGLSFHTFQSISYTVEVYRNNIKAERHLGIYALYVLFFPQMVAGPIERPQNVIPQLKTQHYFSTAHTTEGLRQILLGLVKKILIADNIALLVDSAYENPEASSVATLIVATYLFAFQIYFDFSGYSDIALGSARIFGIDLMKNFDQPYLSRSISDFWRRWHISLSSWFKDYVYVPLGGNKLGLSRLVANLFFVFLLSGLWHGASWTFVIWGGIHGFYLAFALIIKRIFTYRENISDVPKGRSSRFSAPFYSIVKVVWTFHLVCFAWIFFRANSVSDAFEIVSKIFSFKANAANVFCIDIYTGVAYIFVSLAMLMIEYAYFSPVFSGYFARSKRYQRWTIYISSVMALVYFGQFSSRNFIYFQF